MNNKRSQVKSANKPCVECKGRVTVHGKKNGLWRICDECGYEEKDQ